MRASLLSFTCMPLVCFVLIDSLWFIVVLGSLRNDDGDGNENGKKAIEQKYNFARVSRFFVHFFAVTARLQRENV